jgi:hypothetical protein
MRWVIILPETVGWKRKITLHSVHVPCLGYEQKHLMKFWETSFSILRENIYKERTQ